jgi:hypothetical protein
MDEFHHVPTWLPSWSLDRQLEFFTQRRVEVAEVKEYGAQPRRAVAKSVSSRRIAQVQHHRIIGLVPLPNKVPAKPRPAAPIAGEASAEARSRALFRNTHGTTFDPGSSVDRAKMGALRLKLLSRNQSVGLRPE